ncbi:MAG: CoA transferase [Chloroflexi bacterium]|nr:CoA transferase [Chloroflexota bacterium]
MSGSYTSLMLRHAGARVIKIEPPEGDYARRFAITMGSDSAVFFALNRGKESVVLDLTTESGRAALRRLLKTADVFVDDLGPDRAAALGLDHATLSQDNPRLIQASITPFGDHGPHRNRPGSELVVQAAADYPNSLGSLGEPPRRVGTDIGYINSAIFLYQAVLAAIFQRLSTGRGQRASVSMMGSLIYTRKTVWAAMGYPDTWIGAHTETYMTPPTYAYKTKDGAIYFSLRRGSEEQYFGLLDALGILEEALEDERFGDGGRAAVGLGPVAQAVKPLWERGLANLTSDEALALIQSFGAEGVPVNTHASVLASEQVAALDLLHTVEHPELGDVPTIRMPWRIDGEVPTLDGPAPALGAHTASVLSAAGYSAAEAHDLGRLAVAG